MTRRRGRPESGRPQRVSVALILDAVPPWSKGGRERRYAELFSRWERLDLDLTVYSMKWWPTAPPGPITYRATMPLWNRYRHERRSTFHSIVFALSSLQLAFRQFDVIATDQMPYLQIFPLRFIAWIRRVPLVVDWHELWSDAYWREYLGDSGGRLGALIERAAMRLPDVLVADSSHLATQLRAAGAASSRIIAIPNAIDRERANAVVADADAPRAPLRRTLDGAQAS